MATTKTTFNILFYLRLERKNKNGAPLMMRVTINGKSAKTSLGIRVQPKDWDTKRSRCRLREHTEGKRINIFIENVTSKCNRAYTTLKDEYDLVTSDMVVNTLQRKEQKIGSTRIVWYLERYHGVTVSESSVTRILTKHGMARLKPGTPKRRLHSKRYNKKSPGHHVQIDVKINIFIRDGKKIKRFQYTAIDDATRIRALKIYDKHTQAQ